jgi:SNF2 family DNA or RNA helicase
LGKYDLKINVDNKIDWFDIEMMVKIGDWTIPFVRFKRHILSRLREFRLPDGEIFILPESWFAKFSELLSFGKTEANRVVIRPCHFMLLTDEISSVNSVLQEKIKALVSRSMVIQDIPQNLNAQLRNYQHDGFNWLYHLWQNRMNGCLADDMGLGKTLQTLVLLLKLKRSAGNDSYPYTDSKGQLSLFQKQEPEHSEHQPASLIVLPVSLMHNWENEIRKFAPSLKVYSYSGVKRRETYDLAKLIHQCDIILTTYGTVRNDADVLSKYTFFYLILDESQNIKNAESKSYRAVISLQSRHRLALTGTPIENSLSDLWSQMNFLNPGQLGSYKFFRENYLLPIEKEHNPEVSASLNRLIEPFILRRTKEQVEEDLPPVMEETLTIEMTSQQMELYESEKSSVRNYLLQNLEELEPRNTTFIVLQALTRLRQIAIHPRLIDQSSEIESGKFNEIISMLEILVAENHKILVFSSFVKHLNLLDETCRKMKWGYCRLTGQTTDRKSVIEEFQSGHDKNIFLISLKAGGVGLNLTAADYIFIIDPWWNPASEMQAISRAHRIGQHKKVFVYRFISENSIEEKIQLLQEKKAALANEFINRNDPFAIFGKEELIQLFE